MEEKDKDKNSKKKSQTPTDKEREEQKKQRSSTETTEKVQEQKKQSGKPAQPTGAARMRSAPNIKYNIPNIKGGKPPSEKEFTTRDTTAPKGTVKVRQSGSDLKINNSNGQGATSRAPRANRSYFNTGDAPPKPIEKVAPRERPQGYQPVKPLIKRGTTQKPIFDSNGMIVAYEVENIIFDPLTGDSKKVKQTTKLDKPIRPEDAPESMQIKKESSGDKKQDSKKDAKQESKTAKESGSEASGDKATAGGENADSASADNWAETHDFEIRHEAKEAGTQAAESVGPMSADAPDSSPSIDLDLSSDDGGEEFEIEGGTEGGTEGGSEGAAAAAGDEDYEQPSQIFSPEDPENYEEFDPELEEFEEIEDSDIEGDEYEGEEYEGEEYESEEYEGEEESFSPPPPPPPQGEDGQYNEYEEPEYYDTYEDYEGQDFEDENYEQLENDEDVVEEPKKKKKIKIDNRTQEEKEEDRRKRRKLLLILLLLLLVFGLTFFGVFIAPEVFKPPVVYYINPTTDQETFIISKELQGVKFMPGHTILFEEVLKIKNNVVNEEGIKNNMFAFSVSAYIEYDGVKQPENYIERIVFSSDAAYTRYKDNRSLYFYRDVVAPSEEVDVIKGIVLSGPNLTNSIIAGKEVNLIFEVEACYPAEELLYEFSFYDSKMISWIYQILNIADELKNQGYQ